MAILDDVIGVFSPGWKAARLRSRAVIQAYEAVKTTRTHKARRENRTADQLSQYGAVSLREQARYLDNNHDLVIGVFDKLEERVVGKNGIIVEPHPVLRNGAIARDLAAEIPDPAGLVYWCRHPPDVPCLAETGCGIRCYQATPRSGPIFTVYRGVFRTGDAVD